MTYEQNPERILSRKDLSEGKIYNSKYKGCKQTNVNKGEI